MKLHEAIEQAKGRNIARSDWQDGTLVKVEDKKLVWANNYKVDKPFDCIYHTFHLLANDWYVVDDDICTTKAGEFCRQHAAELNTLSVNMSLRNAMIEVWNAAIDAAAYELDQWMEIKNSTIASRIRKIKKAVSNA